MEIKLLTDLSTKSKLIEELRFYMSNIKVGQATMFEQQKVCDMLIAEIENDL